MRITVVKKALISRVLERKKRHGIVGGGDIDLKDMLKSILKWANEFVPSKSGSILLDDPILDHRLKKPGKLYFMACFGTGSASLTGSHLNIEDGIAGKTYRTGRANMCKDVSKSRAFFSEIDRKIQHRTKSMVCVPITIQGTTIGVLELINRVGKPNYSQKDLTLLKIFAGYTSTLIQNSLDAKRFSDLSVRDNLTGLYNDRYFFKRLSLELGKSARTGKDISIIFMDLDNFKQINDSHGHLAGSQLLTEVGKIIHELVDNAPYDIVPLRYGGDEFTLVMPQTDVQFATLFAESLRKEIEDHTFLATNVPGRTGALKIKGIITASLGVASLNKNVSKRLKKRNNIREALIKAADTAMYKSKNTGKNKVTVAPKASD
ncbi:diguanylate cyclase/phosphodiesterase (GGDEF & EAL domains) with PAS/PAC sensor(s) [hydrothermal vent metagenome]|uniref:Diguanylate cyclase/phosphodiesterase (GGDEF & EAL domains) with PAS/PAC sensor(S) n=1 Tax=hydrothermal vent metagenome TaxID=652676 RepID=A0A3B0RJK7_9ZZZZ